MSVRPLRGLPAQFKEPPAQPTRSDLLLELDISVMTVVYGGGAEAGRNDPFDPFRVPSIRGQLRFWWRASLGGQCKNEEELRKKEAEIWGDTDHASPVKLRVLSFKAGVERPAAQRGPEGRWTEPSPEARR